MVNNIYDVKLKPHKDTNYCICFSKLLYQFLSGCLDREKKKRVLRVGGQDEQNSNVSTVCSTGCLACGKMNSSGINKEQGVSVSRDNGRTLKFKPRGSTDTNLSALRNKVRKEALFKAHTQAVKMAAQQKLVVNTSEAMTEPYIV